MSGTLERKPSYPPPVAVRKRQSEALVPRAFRAARRNSHVSVPLAAPPAVWTAAEVIHAFGAGADAGIAGGALTAAVWYFSRRKWDRDAEVWYARATAAGLCGWTWAASVIGPAAGLPGEVLGGALVSGAVAWGVPFYLHKRPRGRRGRERLIAVWAAWWEHHSAHWNLGGSRVTDVDDDGITIRLRVQLWAGRQTSDDVSGAVRKIESALQGLADTGMVRVQRVKGNPSQADVFLKRRNPLAEPVEWDESAAPASVLDPWYPGVTETGQRRPMRQLGSVFAIGQKGSGKSTLLLARLLSLCGCGDAVSILIDLKGGRSARPVLETCAADYVITEIGEAEMAYKLAEAEILARMEGAYDGHEQLTPSASTPAIFLHVDETHRLSSVTRGTAQAAASMAVVATTGRSACVQEDVVTQYGALESSVRTEETRMNLDLRFVFYMPRADMASFAVNEWAKLDVSKLDEPGECYANDKGETDPERLRGVNVSHDAFREIAPARVAKRGRKQRLILWCGNQPCPAGGTWQEWWDTRWSRLPAAFRAISPQYREWAGEHGEPEAEAPAAPEAERLASAPASPEAGSESGAEVAARIAAETSGFDAVPTALTAARASGSRERGRAAFAAVFSAAGPGGISRKALAEQSGQSLSWLSLHLPRLVAAGAAVKVGDGVYAPVPGVDIRSALDADEAAQEELEKDAREAARAGRLRLVHHA